MITPRFVPIVSVTGLVSLVACGLIAMQVERHDDAQRQRDCERTVAVREDNRSMWLYLVDTNTDADQATVNDFVKALNDRLPRLVCRDGNAVPVKP